jgi:hypothetical protein
MMMALGTPLSCIREISEHDVRILAQNKASTPYVRTRNFKAKFFKSARSQRRKNLTRGTIGTGHSRGVWPVSATKTRPKRERSVKPTGERDFGHRSLSLRQSASMRRASAARFEMDAAKRLVAVPHNGDSNRYGSRSIFIGHFAENPFGEPRSYNKQHQKAVL